MNLNRSIMWLLPILMCTVTSCKKTEQITMSGNPLFEGWYADPEAIIYDDTYWIILHTPTLMKNKFFLIAFLLKIWSIGLNIPPYWILLRLNGLIKTCGHLR